jgi:spermidine/putrescine transport system substrate-binding protein
LRNLDRDLNRREFLGRAGLLAGLVAAGPSVLAACSSSSKSAPTSTSETTPTLAISNWPNYIDKVGSSVSGAGSTIDRFEHATGVQVRYTEDITDNDAFFATIQPILATGNRVAADIIVPTYWLTARLIMLEWLEKLPPTGIPNASNVLSDLQKPLWDPTGEFSLPWQTGMTGIAYNRRVTGRDLTSANDLFDPAFKGKIGMLDEMRDTVGLVSLGMNIDPSMMTFNDAQPVFAKLTEAKHSGQIRRFTGNDYQPQLKAGLFAACIGWSSDVAQLTLDDPDIRFVVPKEGGMLWADTMVIPKHAQHLTAAAQWMNFVYEPAIAARITAAVQYISPCTGVAEELRKMGGAAAQLANNPLLFPDAATRARLSTFANLSDDDSRKFNAAFKKLTS